MSIGFHLTSPKSAGLFSKAIMESNPSGFNYKNLSEANVYGQTFCQLLNCTTGPVCSTTCIQGKSPQAITKAWGDAAGNVIDFILADWGHLIDGFLQFTPVVDGEEVVMEPLAAIQSGNWDSSVPLLLGTNTNEGETFIYAAFDFEVPGFLIALGLDVIFTPEDSAKIAAIPRYNMSGMDSRNSLSNVLTDYWYVGVGFRHCGLSSGNIFYVFVAGSDAQATNSQSLPPVPAQRRGYTALITSSVVRLSFPPLVYQPSAPKWCVTLLSCPSHSTMMCLL
jgi:hypothetical protein